MLYELLERKPQAISQWNVEVLLSSIASLSSADGGKAALVPYLWLCRLAEVVIKKHRLRLEGHYHIITAVMQSLLAKLFLEHGLVESSGSEAQEALAGSYARLVTMICEPTAGAVARSRHSVLDSATDAAKKSAGRHMYLILMQYVKLQLEVNISRQVRDSLEPAMNSIFDITPPEGRKILNDAMDSNGRAILREMFKRYTKFGKWSGV
jgi:nucleolar pre-ribosomal-associated protein 2